jgi:hypothetical protein
MSIVQVHAAQIVITYRWKKQNQIGTWTTDPGETFLIVTVTITNYGYSDFDTSPYFFRLDADSTTHGISPATFPLPDYLTSGSLPDGASRTGTLAFRVPQAATSFTLRYERPSRTYDIRYRRGCIIATAAYGSELEPHVQLLRQARDQRLLSTFAGLQFIRIFDRFYYSFSPEVAEIVGSNSLLAEATRLMLSPLIQILKILIFVPATEAGMILGGLTAAAFVSLTYMGLPVFLIVLTRRKETNPH